jgi:hypothetical protein
MSAYAHARDTPALIEQKAKGKLRHIGSPSATEDDQHEMLARAAYDGLWDVFAVAFHAMHQSAQKIFSADARTDRHASNVRGEASLQAGAESLLPCAKPLRRAG